MGCPVLGSGVRLELDDPADPDSGRVPTDESRADEQPRRRERLGEECPIEGGWRLEWAVARQWPDAGKTALTPSGMSTPKTARKAGMSSVR